MQFSENRTFQRKKFDKKKTSPTTIFKLFLLNYRQLEENKHIYLIPRLIAVNF